MPYTISAPFLTIDESVGTILFTVTRTNTAAETLYVSTTPDQGFANSGDYTGLLNVPISFMTGQTTATVSLIVNNDATVESSESFGIIVQSLASDPANVYLAKAIFTIQDNDTPVSSAYSIATANPVVDENAGTVTFQVTRSNTASAQTLYVSTTPDQGFANSGDYTGLLNQTVSFAAGQATATISLKINDDATVESSETFGIILQSLASDPANIYLAKTTFTIKDNDLVTPPPPSGPVLLTTYPATGYDNIGQGGHDNDDSHAPNTARQWSYDFLTPNLTDVRAVQGGTVVAIKMDQTSSFRGLGNVITILTDGGFYVTFAHLAAFSSSLTMGARLETGQIIAKSGDSGSFDGSSLHPNLHVQFGSTVSLQNANFSDSATATLVANGLADAESPAYFPKLTIHFDSRADTGLSTDTDYYGTRGIDDFYGNSYANKVEGFAGDDLLRGKGGNDSLYGGDGNDLLDGGSGKDTLVGGAGDDTYVVDSTSDTITELTGQGIDTVQSNVTWTLGANVENLVLTGTANLNGTGNGLANTITGNSGANTLTGNDGDDVLNGGAGIDSISGGNGADVLTGGTGRDTMTGGAGADRFVFSSLLDSTSSTSTCDIITDFVWGIDKIDMSAFDASQSLVGIQDFVFVGTGTFTAEGQVRAVQSGANTILQFNSTGDLNPDMIVTLNNVTASALTVDIFLF